MADWISAPLYYSWVVSNFTLFNSTACLCNWFPLTVLVEFAAEKGFRVRLDYWPGSAPTEGPRFWDTSKKLIHDSHGGGFSSKVQYLSRVKNTVTARMIGSLNSVAIAQSEARPGDLVSRDYNNRGTYWHVELITNVSAGGITTQAGSAPTPVVPNEHENTYLNLAEQNSVYQRKPRRWEFEEILSS